MDGKLGTSQRKSKVAASPPASWATMKSGTSAGRMPANVSLSDLAIVTAGLACGEFGRIRCTEATRFKLEKTHRCDGSWGRDSGTPGVGLDASVA